LKAGWEWQYFILRDPKKVHPLGEKRYRNCKRKNKGRRKTESEKETEANKVERSLLSYVQKRVIASCSRIGV
jgi:hypothetical protein